MATLNPIILPVTYDKMNAEVKPNQKVLISDGLIKLKVIRVTGDKIECSVLDGGKVFSHKGINLPETIRIWPHKIDMEGFFVAKLVKL